MQKKLIVLAIAAMASAPAFADSTVTVYGLVDAVVASVGGDGLQRSTQALSGGLATSRLGVKASEDLDNGMKAIVGLEYGLDTETQTAPGETAAAAGSQAMNARSQMLALAGGFGTVATGYLETTGNDFGKKYDVVGGSAFSPLQNITNKQGFLIGAKATATRTQRALAYISPNISGLTIAVNYTTAFAANGTTNLGNAGQPTTAAPQVTATLLSADYTAGPLAVAVVYAATNQEAYTANVKEYAIGASYDLGVAVIKATYQDSKADNATVGNTGNDNKAYSIGATVPVASGVLALSYAKSTIGTATVSGDSDAKGYTIAYLQPMSKTVTAYAGYTAMTAGNTTQGVSVLNDATTGVAAGGTTSAFGVGLQKKF